MGDSAFQAAKDHIDHAASAARGGDESAADFHVGMAQQYAALGSKNHLMGKYVDDTKGKTPMPVLAQAQTAARKAETEIARLQKNWDDRNAAHRGGEQDKK
jgi:HEPN domain-containing protein